MPIVATAVPTTGPLPPEEVKARTDKILAGVDPGIRAPLEPIVTKDIEEKSDQAASWSGASASASMGLEPLAIPDQRSEPE
ncbi:MAG TPA: hypothetical protein VMW19_04530 [Myxococcota bacterium]|nr:hypothetical protein [Myxococcota bacterium]